MNASPPKNPNSPPKNGMHMPMNPTIPATTTDNQHTYNNNNNNNQKKQLRTQKSFEIINSYKQKLFD